MDFSVVICSYNKLRYLRLVVSALVGMGGWKEMILSDDHSDDGTSEWAKEGGVFSKILVQPVRKEYCLNTLRNEGIEAAQCPNVVLLDADCIPQEGYFAGHAAVLSADGASLSVGLTDICSSDGQRVLAEDHRKQYLGGNDMSAISWNAAYGGNMAFPVGLWRKVGGFDKDYDGCWGFEDLDFSLRVKKAGHKIVAHKLSLARHCQHPVRPDNRAENRNSSLFIGKHGFPP